MTDRTAEKTSGASSGTPDPAAKGSSGSGTDANGKAKANLGSRARSTLKRAADEHSANARVASSTPEETPPHGAMAGSAPAAGGDARRPSAKTPRRARLRLTRVDPWSVMKTSFLLSIAFAIVMVIAVFMVWSVLSAAGVWDSINSTVQTVLGGQSTSTFDVEDYVGTSRVLGFTLLVAALDVVLLTAIATLGAFLYNMAAALLGGIEVTLAEDIH